MIHGLTCAAAGPQAQQLQRAARRALWQAQNFCEDVGGPEFSWFVDSSISIFNLCHPVISKCPWRAEANVTRPKVDKDRQLLTSADLRTFSRTFPPIVER